jgi:hypothetical protein
MLVSESIDDFLYEVDNSLKGDCYLYINGKKYTFNIGKLNKYVEKYYKVTNLPIDKLSKMSYWKDFIKEKRRKNNWALFNIDGKWKDHHQISDEEFELFRLKEIEAINKASLKYPIIVTTTNRGKITEILDGNHRVTKASMLGKDNIKAYILPERDIVHMSKKLLQSLR